MSGHCLPSLTVASPLWIWTCSSCASEERWWWGSRERRRLALDTARVTQMFCISGFYTPHLSSAPWLTFFFPKFSTDGGLRWMMSFGKL